MSACDFYLPDPLLTCPVCNGDLREWRGYDDQPCYFVWRQGHPAPVDQRVDQEIGLKRDELRELRLPKDFVIFSEDCPCPHVVCAYGFAPDGVWNKTIVVTGENARQWKHEPRTDFRRRMKWLRGEL